MNDLDRLTAWLEHRLPRCELRNRLIRERRAVLAAGGDWTEAGARLEAWRRVMAGKARSLLSEADSATSALPASGLSDVGGAGAAD